MQPGESASVFCIAELPPEYFTKSIQALDEIVCAPSLAVSANYRSLHY